ncbi:alanine dehydrogenase [Aneurinibacillus sp. Ricciae_BoGa-3]|uniref:alanine dehydrogenase n=1 Tax=Aneurinibacillus sp. Ricciae_BoGa-3 TaxID=3022697 RepID=UPI0023419B27|nr:alanine dehydrogenase [Aneurinibacillus sp. Ricciae_BoGa-3]WCK54031.1 alanine dehydrogenase [Aneurinibacillus sp. Ricciae_BoGa-3]
MIVGIPKEIKNNENRVAITPAGVAQLVHAGQKVIIETNAGLGSGFSDQEYKAEGAKIVATAKEAWSADMIMKVKEPLEEEFQFFREGLVLFTYLHLAPEPELTKALIDKKVIAIAYETVQLDNGALPLLSPMSEVAGRMAVQIGAQFLEKFEGGKGILLGGVPGVEAAKVTVVGGGIVGTNAAKIALGMGARVTLLDINPDRLRYLDEVFGGRVQTLMSNRYNIAKAVKDADLLIGAVLIPGARAPRLVTEDMVKQMEEGSVIVDVAIDQGGSIETIDRITTHSEPTYVKHGVVHYAVANMPGAVARTSTLALTNSTMPYAVQLATKGYLEAARSNKALAKGFNVIDGKITFKGVADALSYQYIDINDVLAGGKTV